MKSTLLFPVFLAILASLVFSFLLYPDIARQLENNLVSDRYDDLAKGLVEYGTLSYYPERAPTTQRTPLYPLLLAAVMAVAGGALAVPALVMQAVLHGITTLLAMLLALRFGSLKRAVIAGVLCAVHPALLWYSGRIVIEPLSTLLMTLLSLAGVAFWTRPASGKAAATGALCGICMWCKVVFAPLAFAFALALLLRGGAPRRWRHAALVAGTALLVIAPWIVRNAVLTGQWPIVQTVVGLNLYTSDSFVDHADASPFAYAGLLAHMDFDSLKRQSISPDSLRSTAWCEARNDGLLLRQSLARYLRDPGFLAKKIAWNAVWFWSLGSTPHVSLLMGLLQGMLLAAVCASAVTRWRHGGWSDPALIPLLLVAAWAIPHFPVFALARFSVPLIPSLLAVAVSGRRK